MALEHCFSGTNGVPSQRIGKAAPQPAAGKVASALSGPLLGTATDRSTTRLCPTNYATQAGSDAAVEAALAAWACSHESLAMPSSPQPGGSVGDAFSALAWYHLVPTEGGYRPNTPLRLQRHCSREQRSALEWR